MKTTVGNMNYNGVVIKLVQDESTFELSVKYSKHWKSEGHLDMKWNNLDEDKARYMFRREVKANISIY